MDLLKQIIKKYRGINPIPIKGESKITFRCEIMNKCFPRGCYYEEDDWSISCYGDTIEEMKQDLLNLPEFQLLEIYPSGYEVMIVEHCTIRNVDGSIHTYDIELEEVTKHDKKLRDKIVHEIDNALFSYKEEHKNEF